MQLVYLLDIESPHCLSGSFPPLAKGDGAHAVL